MKRLLTCALGLFVALSLTGCFSLMTEGSSANVQAGATAMDIVTLPVQAAAVVVGQTVTAPFQPKPSSKPPQPGITKLYRFDDGSIYEGAIGGITAKKGVPSGNGRYTRPGGTDLSGKFVGGHPSEVQGTVVFGDGMKLVGEWHGHRKQGKGTISWPDGTTYAGEWIGGAFFGTMREETGTNDAGEKIRFFFPMRSVPQGTGTKTWPDGRKFQGGWHQGLMHGQGQMTLPDGTVQKGVWQGDKFVGS